MPTPEITSSEYGLFPVVAGLLEIPLDTPAWGVESYLQHFDSPPTVGDDRPITGNPGRLSMPDELDEAEVSLRMTFYGTHDYEGTPHSDPIDGIRANLIVFRTNVMLPPGTADGSRPYEFHQRNGDVWTGDVKVKPPLGLGELGPLGARGILKIIVPGALLELMAGP